jgi:hypothetical protein
METAMTRLDFCLLPLALVIAGCVAQGSDLTDDATDPLAATDPVDEATSEEVDQEAAALFGTEPEGDLTNGFEAAVDHLRDAVALEFGEEVAANLPDLLALWQSNPPAGEDPDPGYRNAGNGCPVAAVVSGVWVRGGPPPQRDNHYAGLWFTPNAERLGPMGGHFRELAAPGGQWGGGFGTFAHPLGHQGGMFHRAGPSAGPGAHTFGGLWSVPNGDFQGHVGGHWVPVDPRGGFFLGGMAVCPW